MRRSIPRSRAVLGKPAVPWAALLGIGLAAAFPAPGLATDPKPQAVMLPVQLPITGNRDTQVKGVILRHLDRLKTGAAVRGVLVLRFDTPEDDALVGSDFGRALDLARFLSSSTLAGVKTVAFLPRSIQGHAVLAVLACEEIVMAPDAVLGPANADEPVVDDAMRAAYREIAMRRRAVPASVAVALLDPAARVIRASTESGEQYVDAADLAGLRERVAVLETQELGPTPLELTGRRGRAMGLVRRLADTPADLATGLGLDASALEIDPSTGGGWRPAVVAISGPITADAVVRAKGRITAAITEGATLVCLRIDSPGGIPEQSLVLATWLADLDPARVRTVAYVPNEARADAALVAPHAMTS